MNTLGIYESGSANRNLVSRFLKENSTSFAVSLLPPFKPGQNISTDSEAFALIDMAEQKELFLERSDLAIVVVNEPIFAAMSVATAYLRTLLPEHSGRRMLVVSSQIASLKNLWNKASELEANPEQYSRTVQEKRLQFAPALNDNVLADFLQSAS